MNRIIAKYQITYLQNSFVQNKYLVSKEDWDTIIKPTLNEIALLPKESPLKSILRTKLNDQFIDADNCFPVGSPFYESLGDGILRLPDHQGGNHYVTWEKL